MFEGRNEIEELETEIAAGAERLIVPVKSDGTVGDIGFIMSSERTL